MLLAIVAGCLRTEHRTYIFLQMFKLIGNISTEVKYTNMLNEISRRFTGEAVVLDFEIGLEVFGAGAFVMQRDDADDAVAMPRAGALQLGRDVGGAADVPVVARDAVADPHATVARHVDHQNLIVADARSVESLPLTVLALFCAQKPPRK